MYTTTIHKYIFICIALNISFVLCKMYIYDLDMFSACFTL